MSDNQEKNKPQIILGGVSGNKELKVRRVHKKKAEPASEAAPEVNEASKVKAQETKAEKPAKAPVAEENKPPKKEVEKKFDQKKILETKAMQALVNSLKQPNTISPATTQYNPNVLRLDNDNDAELWLTITLK